MAKNKSSEVSNADVTDETVAVQDTNQEQKNNDTKLVGIRLKLSAETVDFIEGFADTGIIDRDMLVELAIINLMSQSEETIETLLTDMLIAKAKAAAKMLTNGNDQ